MKIQPATSSILLQKKIFTRLACIDQREIGPPTPIVAPRHILRPTLQTSSTDPLGRPLRHVSSTIDSHQTHDSAADRRSGPPKRAARGGISRPPGSAGISARAWRKGRSADLIVGRPDTLEISHRLLEMFGALETCTRHRSCFCFGHIWD